MRRFQSLSVAIVLLGAVACSSGSSDEAAGASADSTASNEPDAEIHTDDGAGASVHLIVDPPTGTGFAGPGLILEYDDTKNFFGHAGAVNADIDVHLSDGTDVKHATVMGDPRGVSPADKVVNYLGTFVVGDPHVASIEIAFSAAGKRDPAGSKTYRVDYDHPDQSCTVVLRDVAAPSFGSPPSGQFYTWTGHVDVASRVLDGAEVGVEWSADGAAFESEVTTKKVAGAPSGFQRFEFALSRDTLASSTDDSTLLTSFQLSVIPFVALADGTRLFDHNRVPGSESYVLWSGDTAGGLVKAPANATIGKGFAVNDDASICAK